MKRRFTVRDLLITTLGVAVLAGVATQLEPTGSAIGIFVALIVLPLILGRILSPD